MLSRLSLLVCAALCLVPALTRSAEPGSISPDLLNRFEQELIKHDDLSRTINAATNVDFKALSLNREVIAGHDNQFNFKLETAKVPDQKSSGRCWMFAGTNVVTPKIISRLKLPEFKLSQAYLSFWDKLEKANFFLEKMIEYRDRPIDDRSFQTWVADPAGDGGWWPYFEGLMRKYGVVPASVMPETEQSVKTDRMNGLLYALLRKATGEIRRLHADQKSVEKLREYKETVLADVYRLLVYSYGRPPKDFTFRWQKEAEDSAKTKILVEKDYTPMSFFEEYYANEIPQYISLGNVPSKEYGRPYRLKGSRNISEVGDVVVLNLPVEKLKHYANKAIRDSQMVWFACDVGKDNYNDSGIFAVDMYDYNGAFGIDFGMTKAEKINFHEISPTHAMTLVGLDTAATGVPRKWQVENSWGTTRGKDGFWTMYDGWFDEYVLVVMVDKNLLEPDDLALWEKPPVEVEDWEPFFRALQSLR